MATRSYLRDRTNQATGTVTSYAIAAGLFAAAGIFLLAACLVGILALFRWVELHYGMFPAFGAVGGLLVVIAAILPVAAAMKLRQKPRAVSRRSPAGCASRSPPIRSGPSRSMQAGRRRNPGGTDRHAALCARATAAARTFRQEYPGRARRWQRCCWAGWPHDAGNRRAERPYDVPRATRADRQSAPGRSDRDPGSRRRNAILKPG